MLYWQIQQRLTYFLVLPHSVVEAEISDGTDNCLRKLQTRAFSGDVLVVPPVFSGGRGKPLAV